MSQQDLGTAEIKVNGKPLEGKFEVKMIATPITKMTDKNTKKELLAEIESLNAQITEQARVMKFVNADRDRLSKLFHEKCCEIDRKNTLISRMSLEICEKSGVNFTTDARR